MSTNSEPGLLTLSREQAATATVPKPKSRWFTRYLLPLAIVLITLGLLGYAARSALWPATPVKFVRVVAKPVQVDASAATAGVVAQAAGWVEPDPFPIHVSALTGGIIREMLVLEGQPVTPGQVVARLIDDDARLAVQKAQAELALREAEVRSATAMLEAAQTTWDNPVDRDRAVAVAHAALAEARAAVSAADATIAEAKAKFAESQDLNDRLAKLNGIAAEGETRQATFRLDAMRAALETAQRQRDVATSKLAGAEAEVKAATRNRELRIAETQALAEAKSKLAQARASVNQAEATLNEARLRLERTQVKTPVAGVVMQRTAAPGTKMMLDSGPDEAAQVVHLYDPAKLQVRVDVPLASAARIGVGQKARVIVEVLPEREFDGEVTRIVNQADIQKNTLQVKVAIRNPAPQLKPEMLARVKFLAMSTPAAAGAETGATALRVFVPQQLLMRHGGNAAMVWMIDARTSTAHRQHVELGNAVQDGWVDVAEGLQPGDLLIGDHLDRIAEGQKLRVDGELNQMPASPPAKATGKENKHGSH